MPDEAGLHVTFAPLFNLVGDKTEVTGVVQVRKTMDDPVPLLTAYAHYYDSEKPGEVWFNILPEEAELPSMGDTATSQLPPYVATTTKDVTRKIAAHDLRVPLPPNTNPSDKEYMRIHDMYYLRIDGAKTPLFLGSMCKLATGELSFVTEDNLYYVVSVNTDINLFALVDSLTQADLIRGGF